MTSCNRWLFVNVLSMAFFRNICTLYNRIGKHHSLNLASWLIPSLDSVIWYSCVPTTVVAREHSVLSTRFNTCPPIFQVTSKITHDFAAQCSMFTCNLTTVSEIQSSFMFDDNSSG